MPGEPNATAYTVGALLFFTALACVVTLFFTLPSFPPYVSVSLKGATLTCFRKLSPNFLLFPSEDRVNLKLPHNLEEGKALGKLLSRYTETHYYHVLAGVSLTYVLYPFFRLVNKNSDHKREKERRPTHKSNHAVTWCSLNSQLSLQTFSIPGSIFLSFLSGALFGLPVGFAMVVVVSL